MNPVLRFKNAWKYFILDYKISRGPIEKGGYYIDSADMWDICLDSQTKRTSFRDGVLFYSYPKAGVQANPAYISWYGLMCLNKWLINGDKKYLNRALLQGRWLVDNSVFWKNAVRWEYNFDFVNSGTILKAPWPSAMAQGLAISLLIRLYKITGEERMRKLAISAVKLYEIPIKDGGVATDIHGSLYFEEYPAYPLTLILDGTLFALLGLYDVSNEDFLAGKLFKEGITTIDKNWKIWDWYGVWSKFGCAGYLSTVLYHKLNCMLIEIFQNKGYLSSFPLLRWKSGIKLKNIVALFQMKKSAKNYLEKLFHV